MKPVNLPLFLLFTFFFCNSYAQEKYLYSYQDLSHLFYQKQLDSLKKAWGCPVLYKDKAIQKQYKELWDNRTEMVNKCFSNDNYVYDKEVHSYIQQIIDQIAASNPQLIPVKPLLLLDRSPSANAYATGSNIIAVNLGLINFVQSREELALVLAHELSHNILAHAENAMKQKAEWLSSEEYKQSLNTVLDSKYERLSRLKKVFEGYSFDRSRHQRYHETDADSLAIVLLNKSRISFDPGFFLRLDSSDMEYRQCLQKPLKEYITAYHLPFEETWAQKHLKGLSTRAYNFKDTVSIQDSLKTHPDCIARYNRTLAAATPNKIYTPVPAYIKEKTNKMLIWNMYCNAHLTPCLYRILLTKDNGNTDEWYDFMLYNVFAGLFYADKQLKRFNAIGVQPKEYISKNYYELQTLLEQLPRESLETYCKTLQSAAFWGKMNKEETGFKNFLRALLFEADNTDKAAARAAKDFMTTYPASSYREYAALFDNK